ncbi:hypothetical protein A1O3_00808 [Capronia epimyces CBS 606.96]|uniref:Myocyte-specific enhancer factor 2d n=1 Tax=Capronia epimyces CBS 606.96 TaxID=1182542 RepID=W9YI80_9EURO|nr:uncharacterized protein A1O3_00808 [Capronia epimyces CBS 606.96]EXJ92258.1 hypothetical protein A1O3_00808 [Capronia epimyces CBS 606.96]
MPADIPGYYYDPSTNRYFKIQANHIAPPGSNYSRQAVSAEKAIQTTQRLEEASKRSKQASTVTRSRLLHHPLLNFDRRLGNLHTNARTYVREYYGSSLSGADAFSEPLLMPPTLGYESGRADVTKQFSVEESTGTLLTALSYNSSLLCLLVAFDRPNGGVRHDSVLGDADPYDEMARNSGSSSIRWPTTYEQPDFGSGGHLYSPHRKRVLRESPKPECLVWAGPELACWSHETFGGVVAGGGANWQSELVLSRCSTSSSAAGLDMMVKLRFQSQVLDLAMSPSRTSLAIAHSAGVAVVTDVEYTQQQAWIPVHSEQMKIAFKDEHIFMSGSRSGKLIFGDIRTSPPPPPPPGSGPGRGQLSAELDSSSASLAALRIQHSSAISGIVALPDGNRVLVNGLTDMKIYDLRFISAPVPNRVHDPRPTGNHGNTLWDNIRPDKSRPDKSHRHHHRHQHHHHDHHRHRHNQSSYAPTYMPSTPVVTFDVPATRRQNRYGMAFAYDPELDLVLSASTDNYRTHRVGLWSAASGQLLQSQSQSGGQNQSWSDWPNTSQSRSQSPGQSQSQWENTSKRNRGASTAGSLTDHRFDEPVTCAAIVRVRDGPKSILLASAGNMVEWAAQGRGFEWEEDEQEEVMEAGVAL